MKPNNIDNHTFSDVFDTSSTQAEIFTSISEMWWMTHWGRNRLILYDMFEAIYKLKNVLFLFYFFPKRCIWQALRKFPCPQLCQDSGNHHIVCWKYPLIKHHSLRVSVFLTKFHAGDWCSFQGIKIQISETYFICLK